MRRIKILNVIEYYQKHGKAKGVVREVNKEESLSLKGISIIMMFWHHLFGCGTFLMLPENNWFPTFGKLDEIIGGGVNYVSLCLH